MEKLGQVLKGLFGAVLGILAIMLGRKAASTPQDTAAERKWDAEALSGQGARQVLIRNEEKRQHELQQSAQSTEKKLADESQRIEGLDRDAVANELRSLDTAAATATPVSPAGTPGPKV